MSYLDQAEIATNASMLARVAQCAAQQKVNGPDDWTNSYRRIWAAAPGWDAAWASAQAAHADDPPPPLGGTGYDPGADASVITDGMILSQVQNMVAPAA